jgi:hypothetical protein
MYLDRNHHWREAILLTVPIQEKHFFLLFFTQTTLGRIVVSSAVIMGGEMGEMSKLG